jgi:3-hydroxyacyl-[acyl-carrier-protein] dehydratase
VKPPKADGLTLPLPAEGLVPHRPPVLSIDEVVEAAGGEAVVEARLRAESPLAEQGGRINGLAALEVMAQAYAAVKGYRDSLQGKAPGKGFLVGVRGFRITESLHVGDTLRVTVKTIADIAGFAVAEAEVTRRGNRIASATLKMWIPETPGEGEA